MHFISKTLVALLCILLAASPAGSGSMLLIGVGPPPVAAGGGFVGLGDLTLSSVTLLTYNGMRCFKNTSTANIADITDASTGSTTGTRLKCNGAGVVVETVGATCGTTTNGGSFVTGNTCSPLATTCASGCRLLTLYDTSGLTSCTATPCDLTQSNNATRPSIPTTQNGYQVIRSSANAALASVNNFSTFAQPYTLSSVAGKRTDITGGSMFFGAGTAVIVGYINSANTGDVNAGANPAFTMSDAAYHSLQAVVNGSSSQACVDSTACNTGLVSGVGVITGSPAKMFNWFGNSAFDIMEGAIFTGVMSGADITTITNNQHSASGYNF